LSHFLTYAIPGLPYGCVFALVGVGLVLTYKTSGVFNLAFGAQAYVSASVYYATVHGYHWNRALAAVLAIAIVGPALGLALDWMLFRHIRTAPPVVKLITTLGLLVGLPSIVDFFFGTGAKANPPDLFLHKTHLYHFSQYVLDGNQVSIVLATVIAVIVLGAMFRFTTIGLKMRAVVESPRMVQLSGINAEAVGGVAWMLSSALAGLAGVLLAPLYSDLTSSHFTTLLVAAIAAAAFGKLSNLPLTVVGGLVLGVGQELLAGYLPLNSQLAVGLRPSFPFLMLVFLLLFWPGLRSRREAADPLSACDPPPPALASTDRDPRLDRVARLGFPVFVAAFFGVCLFWLPGHYLLQVTQAVVYSTILLSIVMITGLSGQISLCQMTFAGVGAFTAGQLALHYNLPFLMGMVIGAALAALIGALVALPALRLGGLFLALATLAFALMADNFVFPLDSVSGGQSGLTVPRPQVGGIDFGADRSFFLLAMAVFIICAFVVILVRKGTTGQYLAAMRGSEVAAATIGINANRAKIVVFALSAGIAGAGGAMLASLQRTTNADSFNVLYSLVFIVLVLTTGARTVEGAANAGFFFIFLPELLGAIGSQFSVLTYALFGYGTVTYARHPEGILEFQKRRSTEAIARLLDRMTGRVAGGSGPGASSRPPAGSANEGQAISPAAPLMEA
jgi:ABC-type branched-subunit amino acid transport system permease subunit